MAVTPKDRQMQVDTKLVRELAELLGETGLTEIEVEDGTRKIRVSRGGGVAPAQYQPAPAAAPAAAAPAPAHAADAVPADQASDNNADAIRSPMGGTAYLSPEPGAPAFKAIGDKVAAGDTIIIVEAMKVRNPIVAPKGGTLKAMFVEDGTPIEFDQPLFVIA